MKKLFFIAMFLTALIMLQQSSLAQMTNPIAAPYVIGAGGACSNANFIMNCTLGEPIVGVASNANRIMVVGFWGTVQAIQSEGAPKLTVVRSGPNYIVSWPSPSTGFVLQQNTNLSASTWSDSAVAPTDNGVTKSIALPPSIGNKFFRLRK